MHALVIDDDKNNADVLAEMLALEGAETTRLEHPKQINDALKRLAKVDVVFLDLEMPGMNGYEVFQLLRSQAQFQGVPIVAYTVHASELNHIHEMGFSSMISKPLNVDTFSDQLARILSGQQVWNVR